MVVNITRSRRRTTNKETEEAMLAWSVLQDLVGVLAAALLFALLGSGSGSPWKLVGGLVAFILVVIGAAWILPRLLVRLRNEHDIFLLVSVASGLVLAGLGARFFGVPLALAAFVAGLAIGESPEAAEARRRILPFRDLFAVLFFVAIGSLIDPGQLGRAWPWILALLTMLIVFKVAPTYLLARLARLAQVRPLQLAVGLGQVGEFSFVIASVGVAAGALPQPLHTAVLVTVLISIGISSTAVRLVRRRPEAQRDPA